MRYFRTADSALYEQLRHTLDDAWGHPTPDGRTTTCFDPIAVAPRDAEGRILLAVQDEFADYSPANELLPPLLASGEVEEITADEYTPWRPEAPGGPAGGR